MPDSGLQNIIDGVRARLQAELDTQLSALSENQGAAIARARQEAEREAEERWSARVEATRQEWSARLAGEVDAVRAEAERRLVAETMRVRLEAEQAAAEASAAVRAELDHRLAEERRRAEEAIEAQRAAAEARIEAEREAAEARLEAERAAAQARIDAERDRALADIEREREQAERVLAEAQLAIDAERVRPHAASPDSGADSLAAAVAGLDGAQSLSDVLSRTADALAAAAPRAAVFVVNGPQLEEWRANGHPQLSSGVVRIQAPGAGLLGQAVVRGTALASGGDVEAPAFAGLEPGRAALAVPLSLGDEVVGAVYADAGTSEHGDGWQGAVQILARHAAARIAFLTAVRTAQAVRLMRSSEESLGGAEDADEQSARRYARLLVSEIKLYNEGAVQSGREKRDLLRRLRPEIERARRLYSERIPASTPGRDACFDQELVQTLADGDPSVLGQ